MKLHFDKGLVDRLRGGTLAIGDNLGDCNSLGKGGHKMNPRGKITKSVLDRLRWLLVFQEEINDSI